MRQAWRKSDYPSKAVAREVCIKPVGPALVDASNVLTSRHVVSNLACSHLSVNAAHHSGGIFIDRNIQPVSFSSRE